MPITFSQFIKSLNLKFEDYELKEQYFDHLSPIHDLQHTYRVMLNVLRLGYLIGDRENTKLAFAAAFIHDMARKDDRAETLHGMRAADKKAYLLKEYYTDSKKKEDLKKIKTAVSEHCREVLTPEMAGKKYILLLRDADLLDRFRIEPKGRFRFVFAESKAMAEFSRKLLNHKISIDVFSSLVSRNIK